MTGDGNGFEQDSPYLFLRPLIEIGEIIVGHTLSAPVFYCGLTQIPQGLNLALEIHIVREF